MAKKATIALLFLVLSGTRQHQKKIIFSSQIYTKSHQENMLSFDSLRAFFKMIVPISSIPFHFFMYTIIMSEEPKPALFIQKGFQYENLHAEIINFGTENHDWEKIVQEADGVFMLLPKNSLREDIEEKIKSFLRLKNNLSIIVLAENSVPDLEDLLKKGIIRGYFVKPFSFRNIVNEMRYSVFLLKEKLQDGRFVLRDLELDIGRHEVIIKKKNVYLRHKEFSLLHFFMINKGRILSRNTILEHVWDRNINILTNTVDVHVSQLRKKIENNEKTKFIKTIPCSGYIFE